MNHHVRRFVAVGFALLCGSDAQASPFRSFQDISESSPSKRYKVEAQSPDNRAGSDRRYWQSSFVFTCTDTRTGKILWTRKQRKEHEGPPIELYVSDTGSTVIRTVLDRVICIDREGADRGTVNLLRDALIGTELRDYVHWTTGGDYWDGYS